MVAEIGYTDSNLPQQGKHQVHVRREHHLGDPGVCDVMVYIHLWMEHGPFLVQNTVTSSLLCFDGRV